MPRRGKQGVSMGVEYSPAAKKRLARKRKRADAALQRRFDALCGPVTVRKIGEEESRPNP